MVSQNAAVLFDARGHHRDMSQQSRNQILCCAPQHTIRKEAEAYQ